MLLRGCISVHCFLCTCLSVTALGHSYLHYGILKLWYLDQMFFVSVGMSEFSFALSDFKKCHLRQTKLQTYL